jgi:predicted ATPase
VHVLQLSAAFVDVESGRFVRRGEPGTLGPRRRRLLAALASRPGTARSREDLLDEAWDEDASPRVVDVTVRGLRQDLEEDSARPDHILTVHGAGYRFEPAAAPEPGDGLPGGLDPFFGRGREIFDLGTAFRKEARFVSLVGPAGVGKSRLALRFAASRGVHGLGGGRAFVELAEERDPPGAVRVLAAELGVPSGPDLKQRLAAVLASRGPFLVVLDNLEQLEPAIGPQLVEWGAAAPEVRWLLTSQRPVDVPGVVLSMEPLGPAAAASLFVQRARAVGAREVLASDSVQRVCDRVERLPLALELAAARVPVLGLEVLEAQLERSLTLLVAGARPRPARHLTLEASIRWSWDLLKPPHQASLARASVFRGPFSKPAAAAVGVHDPDELVRSSLIQRRGEGYAMSLSVRAFAAARLQERADSGDAALAHGRWFRARCADLSQHTNTAAERSAADEAQAELPNLRAALETLADADVDQAMAMALELTKLLVPRTSEELHTELLTIPLRAAHEECDPDLRAMAEASRAGSAFGHGEEGAAEAAEAALAWARSPEARAFVLIRAGNLARRTGEPARAVERLTEAGRVAEAAGETGLHGQALVFLGIVEESTGRLDEAMQRFEQALDAARRVGNLRTIGVCAVNLGIVARRRGDREAVRRHHAVAVDAYRRLDSRFYLAELVLNAAVADLSFCDARPAREGLLDARDQLRALGDRVGEALAISNLGMAHLMLGERAAALACLTEGAERHRRAATGRYEAYARLSLGLAHQMDGDLAAAAHSLEGACALFEACADGAPHAVAEAMLALVLEESGDEAGAAELREAARARVDGSREEAAGRAVRVLCGAEGPGPLLDSYDWMGAAAVEAMRSRRGSGTT